MRPFNLEEYLKDPSMKVVTREGVPVRIICTDRKGSYDEDYPIVALIKMTELREVSSYFTKDGKCLGSQKRPFDLFFATEKKEGWINIYHKRPFSDSRTSVYIYDSEKDAKGAVEGKEDYITTIKIEWEE